MARYDISQIKSLATGRWPELLGMDSEILDTFHHPCPKCGGRDRFRALDDFHRTGAVICNKCFNSGNGDGIAAYAWRFDFTMGEAISSLARKLGVKPIEGNSPSAGNQGVKKTVNKRVKNRHEKAQEPEKPIRSLAEAFKFVPWNSSLAAIFCQRKGGIDESSLVAIGAELASHSGITVVTLRIRNELGAVIGYTAANVTGGKIAIPSTNPEQPADLTSWKNVKQKGKGIIATNNFFDSAARDVITRVYKTEGPSDLLAIIPLLLDTEAAFCNPCGAGENPEQYPWLADWIAGKQVIVIHDRDAAGVVGALGDPAKKKQGWATWAAAFAAEVRNVDLPYPLVESHGKDLRDWIRDGHDRFELEALINKSAVVSKSSQPFVEADDDPHRLARVNLDNYQNKHGRRLVYWRDEWYRWKNGKYTRIEITELRAKVSNSIRLEFERLWPAKLQAYLGWKQTSGQGSDSGPPPIQRVTRQLVSNVIGAMEGLCALSGSIEMASWIPDRSRPHYVAMGNGILDLDKVCDGKPMEEFLLPLSPNWFSTFQLQYDYSKTAGCPKWLAYLDYVMEGDYERIALIQEWTGYLLTSSNGFQKFMAFEGEGQNGKTVYFAAIHAMLGEENVSSVALENFGGRFDLATTLGKAANISADVGELDHVSEGILKQFTGGDTMQFDRKNRQPISARPTAKLMLSWNKRPRFKDRSKGLWRRMILIPFRRPIPPEKRVLNMDSPQWWIDSGESPGILRWAIIGLDRLKTNQAFTESEVCKAVLEEYQQDTNPAKEFLLDHVAFDDSPSERIECGRLYKLYSIWCSANGNKPLANNSFGKEVMKIFPEVTKDRTAYSEDSSRPWIYRNLKFSVDKICDKFVHEISW
jgi:P4 family phage/plasmid primase-like protien